MNRYSPGGGCPAVLIDFSGFMPYNKAEPEQSRRRCGMFTHNRKTAAAVRAHTVLSNLRKGVTYVKGKDSPARGHRQHRRL